MYPINVVEKETSISKYLLRMWERRYTFPRPCRDQKGERVYTNLDVEKLKLVKKLMEEGYRPSKIIDQPLDQLVELSKSFEGSKKLKKDSIIILANPNLENELKKVLKNHEVITIYSLDDINNLSLS